MSTNLQIAVAVAVGGALGALSRLGLAAMLRDLVGDFPAGTFAVNVLGCFVFGLCWSLHDGGWSRLVAAAVFTGFLGAFTTFSTFAFESVDLLDKGRTLALVVNLLGQNLLGGLGMIGGLALGRAL